MEIVRFLFFEIHLSAFLALMLSILLFKRFDWMQNSISITLFAYIFFLCYFQRGLEERYTLPILMIGLASFLKHFHTLARGKLKDSNANQ